MKPFLRIVSIFGLGLVAFALFIFGGLPLTEGKHPFDPYIDTQFAREYTPEKFEQIVVGMHMDEVIRIIGPPMYVADGYMDTTNTNYHYTSDGKLLKKARNNGNGSYDDFAWYRSSVEFNKHRIVVDVNKGWSYD